MENFFRSILTTDPTLKDNFIFYSKIYFFLIGLIFLAGIFIAVVLKRRMRNHQSVLNSYHLSLKKLWSVKGIDQRKDRNLMKFLVIVLLFKYACAKPCFELIL